MKKRVNKGISILLSVAMLFAMLPSFSGLMASAETEPQAEGAQTLSVGATVTSGYWNDKDESEKYKYADFSPFLKDGNATFDDATVTEYTITNAEQLAGLMILVNSNGGIFKDTHNNEFTISGQQSFDGKTIKLSAEKIDLSAHYWVPIGKDSSFKATIKGQVDTATNEVTKITGMKIGTDNAKANYQYAGLIGLYQGPAISNIGIGADSAVYISRNVDADADASAHAGGIVGFAAGGSSISNCNNEGAISATATSESGGASAHAGGIVGGAYGSISNCNNTGAISATATSESGDASAHAGGIVGYGGTISNCYNTGAISCEGAAGGILGYANGSSISNCYNTGAISCEGAAGGILGFDNASCTISNCYYIGADKGVGNKEDTEYTNEKGDVQLKKILKEAEENLERDESGKMYTTLPNDISTNPIANTSASLALKGADKLGEDFAMVYYFELEGTKEIIVPTVDTADNTKLKFPEDKTGKATLKGVKIVQNALTENGYTGEDIFIYSADLSKSTISGKMEISTTSIAFKTNGGNWAEGYNLLNMYEGENLTLPTATDIQKTGYTFEGWYDDNDRKWTEISTDETGDKTFYAKWEKIPVQVQKYNINVANTTNGTVTADAAKAKAGKTVTLTVTPNKGYQLKAGSLQVNDGAVEVKPTGTQNQYTFKMPSKNVTVTAEFELASGYREIKVDPNTENVTVTPDKTAAKPGEKVTATVEPEDGYEVDKIYVNGEEIPLGADHKFSFTVPEDGEVVITVTMQELNSWVRDPINCEASGTPRWYYYKDSEKLSGWQEVQADGETGQTKRYYFNPERGNSAHTGWMQDETGSWYYFAVNNYRDNTPLKSPAEGLAAMWTGWANDGGPEWYYLDATTGKMHTGWTQDGGSEWYYLDATDGDIKLGWQFIDGKWYYFTDDKSENMRHYGQMQTGWQCIGGDWYYFYADGAMAANTLIDNYRLDENGRWIA